MLFMENIEKLVQKTNMTYIDAVMHYCEENKLEPETAGQNDWTVNLNRIYKMKRKTFTLFRRLLSFHYNILDKLRKYVII